MRDRSQARCVLVQPQVATVLMIVADVSSHEPDEMTCADNHDVLKELATAAADPPLRGSVLPWAVLALFTVGDVHTSLCKRGVYAPFNAQRRSRALFWL